MKNNIIKWLAVGILLRLALMVTTLHPDLWGHNFTSYFFAYEGVINIYDHLLSLSPAHPLVANFGVSDIFIYPPLTYFTLGIFKVLTKPFIDPNFIPWAMENLGMIHTRTDLPINVFLFKLPYLFVDIGVGLLLMKLVNGAKQKMQVFALWMVNPVTLYATFMMGQLDILPVFFTVLALVFAKNKKFALSVIALGIGASYKMYPIFFIIPAALLFSDKIVHRVKYILLGILPFVAFCLPFIGSSAFRQMVLFTPKSQKMLFMNFAVSGAEGIFPFIILLTIIFLVAFYKTAKLKLVDYFLVIMLLVFSVTHYHPQWFLWITPFLIIKLVDRYFSDWLLILVFFISWFLITLSFDASLNYGLFRVVNPDLAEARMSVFDMIAKYTDVNMLKSLIRSAFAGSSIFYAYRLFKQ